MVIDEVHSFSRGMFDKLVSFLEHFDIPVLCMTATLPTARQIELTERLQEKIGKGLTIYPTEEDRTKLEELEKAENHPRYIVESIDCETAYQKAVEAYRQGEKDGTRILWVVNTVNCCREIANRLTLELNTDITAVFGLKIDKNVTLKQLTLLLILRVIEKERSQLPLKSVRCH